LAEDGRRFELSGKVAVSHNSVEEEEASEGVVEAVRAYKIGLAHVKLV
jgi:hypothetical protein